MGRIQNVFLIGLLSILLLPGCAHVISSEARKLAATNIPFQWIAQNPDQYKGIMVIWGGEIIETLNKKEGTYIIVLQRSLGYSEEPMLESKSGGRLLVIFNGFLDPVIYEKGKLITIAGIIEGEKSLPLGETEYKYPSVKATEIHLWKQEELSQCYYYYY